MHRNERGMTLAEVLVSIGILAILIFATLSVTSVALSSSRRNMDKQFGIQKAMAILEELKAVAQGANNQGGVVILDQYDDGSVTTNPLLTIQLNTLPADPISGNQSTGTNQWLYARHISVQNVGTAGATVRRVTVSVYKNITGGQQVLAEVTSIIRTLSNTMPQSQVYDVYAVAIENVPGWWTYTADLVPFVQNAINNLQARNSGLTFRVHWITKLAMGRDQEYRPAMNKGCDTWGNKLAGAPASLDCAAHDASTTATSNSFDWVYFYPGALPVDATANPPALSEYYPAGSTMAHVNLDGAEYNDYAAADLSASPPVYGNPHPYALADQYNHAMRYYDERNLVNARIADKVDTEPTYRMLLDDMTTNPNKYINAIFINLHGELMPFPPIRNYSDAAKDPEQTASPDLRYLRVVTHPENLTSNSAGTTDTVNYTGTGDYKLRVYAYEAPLKAKAGADTAAYLSTPITVLIKGLNLVGEVDIQRITGGTKQTTLVGSSPTNDPYAISAAPTAADGPNMPANGMYATVAASGSDTLITLYNTPYRTPPCTSGSCGSSSYNGQGLATGSELYGMQYIPSPLENFAVTTSNPVAFNTNLTATTVTEKNTARWVIRVKRDELNTAMTAAWSTTNAPITIETRLGTDLTTGVLYPTRNHPANLSRTYHWRGTDLWLYGDGTETNPPQLPMSERYQFIGDARHCPYADLKRPHVTNTFKNGTVSNEHRLGMGYDRYFDDFENGSTNAAANWPGWTYTVAGVQYGVKNDGNTTNAGWTAGPRLEIDIPRAFGIFRTAITASRAIYTTMTGWSYYYIGIGGEIGYDSANQFPNSIPVLGKPFSGSTGQKIYEQSIINDGAVPAQGAGVKYVRQSNATNNYWWSLHWLGELYPDWAYTGTYGYMNTGNLPSGTTATTFRRVLRGAIAPTGASPSWVLPTGTTFGSGLNAAVRRLMGNGSTTFFSTGTTGSTFHHKGTSGTGSLIQEGLTMAASASGYNFPLLNPIPNNRPFSLTMNAGTPDANAFLQTAYGSPFAATPPAAFPVTQQTLFYQEQSPLPGSALFSLRDPVTNRAAFVVVNGLSPTGLSGSQFIANWSFLSLLHSFFVAGLYTDGTTCTGCPFRVQQLPRVSITYPDQTTYLNNPTSINVTWSPTWLRWDGKKYTPTYSNTFAETTPLQYQFSYSKNNGITWFYQDDTPSLGVGVRLPSGDPRILNVATVTWNTPAAAFPQSNYLIRVEAYRANLSLHYSFHQFRAFIWRP